MWHFKHFYFVPWDSPQIAIFYVPINSGEPDLQQFFYPFEKRGWVVIRRRIVVDGFNWLTLGAVISRWFGYLGRTHVYKRVKLLLSSFLKTRSEISLTWKNFITVAKTSFKGTVGQLDLTIFNFKSCCFSQTNPLCSHGFCPHESQINK